MEEKMAQVPGDRCVKVCNKAAAQGRYNLNGYVSVLPDFSSHTEKWRARQCHIWETLSKYNWQGSWMWTSSGWRKKDISLVLTFWNRSKTIQTDQLEEITKDHEIPVSCYNPVKTARYSKSLKSSARQLFDIEYSRSEVECFPSKKGLFFYSLFCIIHGSHVFHHIFYRQSLESLAAMQHNHWKLLWALSSCVASSLLMSP